MKFNVLMALLAFPLLACLAQDPVTFDVPQIFKVEEGIIKPAKKPASGSYSIAKMSSDSKNYSFADVLSLLNANHTYSSKMVRALAREINSKKIKLVILDRESEERKNTDVAKFERSSSTGATLTIDLHDEPLGNALVKMYTALHLAQDRIFKMGVNNNEALNRQLTQRIVKLLISKDIDPAKVAQGKLNLGDCLDEKEQKTVIEVKTTLRDNAIKYNKEAEERAAKAKDKFLNEVLDGRFKKSLETKP